ncbi:hypothetical protein [Mycobacterium bourgelatii]|uniref:Uncharacterized protein n=1 Tax=Mycobacterium bourgelatii TaxID=1273442 RepID=A0A7I9YP94_MYCBU|nr:hypothetical protein [Mycobacterium bourgelatii]MCV6976149.1 hypothetical protein [Mycobacterium bourgelatii]GFG90501.1 hypothetical protein MBOU_25430 [Mycobacterium bourgelatii]
MSEQLAKLAEITKLARLLNVENPHDLDFLLDLPHESLRAFREQVTERLFDADAARLKRVAAASKLVPVAISAKAARHAFGPRLCASIAGMLEPSRGVAIAEQLPTPFLAETAVQLDPRRAASLISAMPPRVIAEVAKQLLQRDDHVTMGRFVGVLPDPSLRAAAPVMGDADLLRIGFLLEEKSRLDNMVDIISDRLPGIVRAAHENDLWAQAIDLFDNVGPHNKGRIGDIAASLGDAVLEGLIHAVDRLEAWDALLPVTRAMSRESLEVFTQHPAVHRESTLTAILDVALNRGLWLDLLPLAAQLPCAQREFIAARVAQEPAERMGELIREADAADEWESLIPIAMAMSDDDRRRMAALPVMQDPNVLLNVLTTCAQHDLWTDTLPLVASLPDTAIPVLASYLDDLTDQQIMSAVNAAARGEHIEALINLALAQDSQGRRRVLELIDGMDNVDDVVAALTEETPQKVWDALVERRDEIPDALRDRLARQAVNTDHADIAGSLATERSGLG